MSLKNVQENIEQFSENTKLKKQRKTLKDPPKYLKMALSRGGHIVENILSVVIVTKNFHAKPQEKTLNASQWSIPKDRPENTMKIDTL